MQDGTELSCEALVQFEHLIHTVALARCSVPSKLTETVLNGFLFKPMRDAPGLSTGVNESFPN